MNGNQRAKQVWIGTSGWHYADWWGRFYPDEVKKNAALEYYATQFRTTELNAPFYRMPTEKSVRHWFDATPGDFRFAWKASRFITHRKRLQVDDRSLDLLEGGLDLLGDKLGPVLFQLPPNMTVDRELLGAFLSRLNRKRRYCFEFRHSSWYVPAIFGVLGDHNVALCLSDHVHAPAPAEITASWTYIRNHGPGGHYRGHYSKQALDDWASFIRTRTKERREVWCYFDNDIKSAAPVDASALLSRLEGAA